MAPTRCGSVPVVEVLKMLDSADDIKSAKALCTKTGGFVSHLGTSDALEVSKKAKDDDYAKLIWDTMIYQITKEIGAMAAALKGDVDGILLGGGMVHNKELVSRITEACSFIAPVTSYPGEFEMEAMAAGAIRVLKGEEQVKTYTGEKIWN
jgi:butyrate kinase